MYSQSREPEQTYKETTLLLRLNIFFLYTLFSRYTSFDVQKMELVCLYICRQ